MQQSFAADRVKSGRQAESNANPFARHAACCMLSSWSLSLWLILRDIIGIAETGVLFLVPPKTSKPNKQRAVSHDS